MISSQTPEGNQCPVCGKDLRVEGTPSGDTPCPSCGCLLLFGDNDGMRAVFSAADPSKFADGLDAWAGRADEPRQLLLDFGKVQFLSSIVLGKLITLSKKAKATGGRLIFCNVRPEMAELFEITKLNQLFEIK